SPASRCRWNQGLPSTSGGKCNCAVGLILVPATLPRMPRPDLSRATVIDTHTHWRPPGYAEFMVEEAARNSAFAHEQALSIRSAQDPRPPVDKLRAQLDDMNDGGIDVSLVSLPPPATTFGQGAFAAR